MSLQGPSLEDKAGTQPGAHILSYPDPARSPQAVTELLEFTGTVTLLGVPGEAVQSPTPRSAWLVRRNMEIDISVPHSGEGSGGSMDVP